MVERAGDQKQHSGRDIGKMFRHQETVLKDWTVHEPESSASVDMSRLPPEIPDEVEPQSEDDWDDGDDDPVGIDCPICGVSIPHFAQLAHQMYHSAPE
jgi:DNA polymerase iota